jgi:hypothetical protein
VLHSARQELPDEFLHSVGGQREKVLSLGDASHEALAQLRARDIILCLTSAQTTQAQVRDAMELLRRVKVAETRVVLYQP